MEDDGHNHEESKENDLYDKPTNDDPLTCLCGVWLLFGEDAGTSRLHHEGEDIAKDENCGEKFPLDWRLSLPVDEKDDVSKLHVDAGSEEYGCDEQEERLDDVWTQGIVWHFPAGEHAADVANRLAIAAQDKRDEVP